MAERITDQATTSTPETDADVIVVGSGAAGLFTATVLAARGVSALVLEAGDELGGSSAMSGGMVWLPRPQTDRGDGTADTRAAVELYLSQLLNGHDADDRIDAFLDTAPRVLDYLASATPVRMGVATDFPDYRSLPGSRSGRSWDQEPFPISRLGDAADRILARANPPLTQRENRGLMGRQDRLRELVRTRRESNEVTSGVALVAALLRAALDAGVGVWASARVVTATADGPEGGGAYRVEVETGETFRARRGIVWASGGYEADAAIAKERLGVAPVPLGATTNRGDALSLLDRLGADTATSGDAWWMPVYAADPTLGFTPATAKFGTRLLSLPGGLLVDGDGRRFTNETLNYYDQGPVLRRRLQEPGAALWAIFDASFARRYPLPGFDPDRPAASADDLATLAAAIGVPADALADTVAAFNRAAEAGEDVVFGRGSTVHDRAIGDQQTSHPNLAPLAQAPFYALPVGLGTIGSNNGVATNVDAQVVDPAGRPIPGLYAIGNVAGSYLGPCYPGAGGTLGPALVAGYRAAQHLLAAEARP